MALAHRPTIIHMHSNYEFCNWKLAAKLLMKFCVHYMLIVFVDESNAP